VEDGTLSDILSSFRKTIGKVKLPVGSVILISSLSHLARVGTAAYAADLQATLCTIEEDYGNRVRAVHGIPVLAENIEDLSTVRAMWDTLDWLDSIDKRAKHMLPNSVQNLRDLCMHEGDPEGGLATSRLHLRLPAGFRSKDSATFMFGGCCQLSSMLQAPTEAERTTLMSTLIEEVNSEFAANLDPAPDMAASATGARGRDSANDDLTLLVAGASHASRLAGGLGELHTDIIDMSVGGWKLCEESAIDMAAEISDHLAGISGKAAVVVQLFDNSIYHGILPNGTRRSPFREEGQYHVEGELATISKERLKELFEMARPIFRAAKDVPTIVLGPIPRYCNTGCCDDSDHITNLEDADYAANVAGGVCALGRHLRQLVWHKRWSNVVVINTAELMGIAGKYSVEEAAVRLQEVMGLWGDVDPVHPKKEAYDNLAKAVLDLARTKALGNGDEAATTGEGQRGIKRPREEKTGRRPDWMAASETAVARRVSDGHHNSGGRGGSRDRGTGPGVRGRRPVYGDKPHPYGGGSSRDSGSGQQRGEYSRAGSGSDYRRGRGGSGGRRESW